MKRGQYHRRAIEKLRGLAHAQRVRPQRLWGVKLGPANRGRRLDAAERQAIEQKNAGRWAAVNSASAARQSLAARICLHRIGTSA